MLRLGGHLKASRHFPDGDAVAGLFEFGDELFERPANPFWGLLEHSRHLRHRERLLGDVDHGFDDRLEPGIFHRHRLFGARQQFIHGQ